MKRILAFGAGRVAKPCIQYLLQKEDYEVFLVDKVRENLDITLSGRERGHPVTEDAYENAGRLMDEYKPDVVLCLLPAAMNSRIARECIQRSIDMTAASYAKEEIRNLSEEAEAKGVTLLFEMGLDPGIDHMSASRTIKKIHDEKGEVISFWSVCGSLPEASSNNNPYGYKLSWAPSSVVDSSKREAKIIKDKKVIVMPDGETYLHPSLVEIKGLGWFEEYANGDSTPYIQAYDMPEVKDVYRGTLRYLGWSETVNALLRLGLYESSKIDLSNMTYSDLIRKLTSIDTPDAMEAAGAFLGLDSSSAVLLRLRWLGLFEDVPVPAACESTKDVIADLYLKKLTYMPHEKDIVIMQHRFTVNYPERGTREKIVSTMAVTGDISGETAISRTTGLPLAIGTDCLLSGKISQKGVVIPTSAEIFDPVLDELEKFGFKFEEYTE